MKRSSRSPSDLCVRMQSIAMDELYGEAEPAAARELHTHLQSCAACSALHLERQQTAAELSACPAPLALAAMVHAPASASRTHRSRWLAAALLLVAALGALAFWMDARWHVALTTEREQLRAHLASEWKQELSAARRQWNDELAALLQADAQATYAALQHLSSQQVGALEQWVQSQRAENERVRAAIRDLAVLAGCAQLSSD